MQASTGGLCFEGKAIEVIMKTANLTRYPIQVGLMAVGELNVSFGITRDQMLIFAPRKEENKLYT